jgi:hypothetical protein
LIVFIYRLGIGINRTRSLFLEVVVFVVLGVVERGVVGTVILVVPCVVAAGQGLKV